MYSVPMSNFRLRLSDYETPTEQRSTHSCIGICHSTERDEETEKNLYFSQVCDIRNNVANILTCTTFHLSISKIDDNIEYDHFRI